MLAVIALGALAPVAQAGGTAVEVPLPKSEQGAVAYGGGRVLWATNPVGGDVQIYNATPGGGAAKLLATLHPVKPRLETVVSLAAGADGYIVDLRSRTSTNSDPVSAEIAEGDVLAVGGYDGSLHTVLRCLTDKDKHGELLEFPPAVVAADDQQYAVGGVSCGVPATVDTVTPTGTVTAVAHPPAFTFDADSEVEGVLPLTLALDGDTLAFSGTNSHGDPLIGMDDLATGAYRQISAPPEVEGLAVRADGTVFVTSAPSALTIAPGQSTLTPLATRLHLSDFGSLLVAGERLLLRNGADYEPDLSLATTTGEALGPVGAPGVSGAHKLLGFTGEQAVYTSTTCTGAPEVTVLSIPATGPAGSGEDGCPMSAASSTVTVGPKGRAAIRLTCPLGCNGALELHADLRGEFAIASGYFKLPAGSGVAHLKLRRVSQRFLRRHHGRVRAVLRNASEDLEATAVLDAPVKVIVKRG